jgi:8-amino-7-oxononanoate synthase
VTRGGPLRHLEAELAELSALGRLRREPTEAELEQARALVVACSNDYLGYAAEPWPVGAEAPSGAGASRLVDGEHEAHRRAERALAGWVGCEDALLFASGYAANVDAISALAAPGDVVVSDALNHASLIDGCRLSGARVAVVPHLDLDAVAHALEGAAGARRRWVVTESYFSMDGDTPDLGRLREITLAADAALVVDEAHALGVFGPRGAGRLAQAGVAADVVIGTLGKALGLQGAFVAGPRVVRSWLWNRARSFVFSTGVSPTLAAAAEARAQRAMADEAGRERLRSAERRLRDELRRLGVAVVSREGPVLPVVVGAEEAALALSRSLAAQGVKVQAIRPPTVAPGSSRLRFTCCAQWSEEALERVLMACRAVWSPTDGDRFT